MELMRVGAVVHGSAELAWRVGRPGTPAELCRTLQGGWKLIAFVRPTNGNVGHYIVL